MLATGVQAFLAPDNLLGWTLADCFALVIAASIALLLRRRSLCVPAGLRTFADRTAACMALLFVLPVVLRLILLRHFGVPTPAGADDFGYIFLADTLLHLRFANPPNPFPHAFAQIFVLQLPKYAAIFPLGQGAALALGWVIFGHPWAGVLVAGGMLCSVTYWMLRGWTSPVASLLGGFIAVAQFGPLCYWANCYWGGYVSALAGAIAFGCIGRLRSDNHGWNSFLLGCGIALQALTRQYETLLLIGALAAPRVFRLRVVFAIPLVVGALLVLAQNHSVTGHWTRLPYLQYRYAYGVPSTFTFEPNPVPHAFPLNAEQELDYRTESFVHGEDAESPKRYGQRLVQRIRFLRFFWSAPLLLAVIAGLLWQRGRRRWWPLAALLLFCCGSNFYPYFYPHYIAAATCLFLLVALDALQRLPRALAFGIIAACALQFVTWYGLHLFGKSSRYEAWDYINAGDPQGRLAVEQTLSRSMGKQIVFVHYSPEHRFAEWVHNSADPDSSKVLWVHDLGRDRNAEVLRRYGNRQPWLLKPDESPPLLERYVASNSPFEEVR